MFLDDEELIDPPLFHAGSDENGANVPEIYMTDTEKHGSKEKWRYRNVRTIMRRLSVPAIDRLLFFNYY